MWGFPQDAADRPHEQTTEGSDGARRWAGGREMRATQLNIIEDNSGLLVFFFQQSPE